MSEVQENGLTKEQEEQLWLESLIRQIVKEELAKYLEGENNE